MIDPPQVRPEEPTAVTPHGGIRALSGNDFSGCFGRSLAGSSG